MSGRRKQLVIDEQLLKQKQDERLSHETLLTFCATAELVATGKLIKYSEYYEHKNNGKARLEELALELAVKLESIRTSYQLFKRDYGFYNFPENLSKEELLGDINGWIKDLKNRGISKEVIQLYLNFSNLIKGFATKKANNNYFLQYDQKVENSEKNCNDFAYALMKEGKRCDKIMDEVEENILKTGTSKTYAKLHKENNGYDYSDDWK